jgi:hypothetical protein
MFDIYTLFFLGWFFFQFCLQFHPYIFIRHGLGGLEFLALLIIAYSYTTPFKKIGHGKSSISFCNFVM